MNIYIYVYLTIKVDIGEIYKEPFWSERILKDIYSRKKFNFYNSFYFFVRSWLFFKIHYKIHENK